MIFRPNAEPAPQPRASKDEVTMQRPMELCNNYRAPAEQCGSTVARSQGNAGFMPFQDATGKHLPIPGSKDLFPGV